MSQHSFAAMENSVVALILSILCAAIAAHWTNQRRSKAIPGPPGVPVIGNLMRMPNESAYVTFNEWARKYSAHAASLRSNRVLMA